MSLKRFGLDWLFGRGHSEPEVPDTPTAPAARLRIRPNPGTTILIIDDSKTTQAILARMLNLRGYQTISAYEAEAGLELVKTSHPALVMMDVVMPGITGFQATRRLRRDSDPHVANVPVIIMSGNQQATEQFWSVKIGANDYMTKPFTEEDVLDRIEKLLFPNAVEQVP